MTGLKLLFGALAVFGGFLLLIYFAQRSLMYFPERTRTAPAAAGLPEAEEVVLDTADGEKVIAWHIPPKGEHRVVLYFHGNGGSLRFRAGRFRMLTANGLGLLAVSYRGYGGSSGSPTEPGLLADAAAAYAYAAARYPAERIALWGESLGSGVAVALAASHKVGRVLLEAPFTSAADVGARVYWFVPVRIMMKDQFRSDLRIRDVRAPIMVLHGTKDDVVPFELGERLFALAQGPKRFLKIEGGGHSNLDGYGGINAGFAFISDAH
jgi:fermentation-respiration switch protein FrsA (DUF1100 family)